MEIGIIGLPQSGKSTLFQIMTGVNAREIFGEQFVKGVARVPDARFEKLVQIFKPAKVSPAAVPFTDVNLSGKEAWDKARGGLQQADGFVHIVPAFNLDRHVRPDCHPREGGDLTNVVLSPEVAAVYRKLLDDLILADLLVVENKLERLAKTGQKAAKPEDQIHANVLPRAKELLENGHPLRELKLTADEFNSLRGFTFWTIRPELVVLNVAEGSVSSFPPLPATTTLAGRKKGGEGGFGGNVIPICCQLEMEIASLPPEERSEFLKSMGIETPAFERVIKTAFALIGRMSYFTVGPDEVKAWVIPVNSTAPKAASAIHKDFERGFIKAEVVSYDDFIKFGSIDAAKAQGKLRLEGKEYIVQDGDIINFRFNV